MPRKSKIPVDLSPIKDMIRDKGYTLTSIAYIAQMSPSQFSQLTTGPIYITETKLKRVLDAAGTILDGDEDFEDLCADSYNGKPPAPTPIKELKPKKARTTALVNLSRLRVMAKTYDITLQLWSEKAGMNIAQLSRSLAGPTRMQRITVDRIIDGLEELLPASAQDSLEELEKDAYL